MRTSTVPTRRLLATGAAGAAVATAANAALYGLGRAADLAFVVDASKGSAGEIRLVHVVGLSLQALAVGLVAALVVNRLGRPSLRSLQILAAVLAVGTVSMDFPIDATVAAKATLGLMHLVVGAAYVTSLRAATGATRAATERPAPAQRLQPQAA